MAEKDELWIPLVDEPLGQIVDEVLRAHPEIDVVVSTPQRVLAFRTFAYIRVGIVLGQLLFDSDLPPYDGSETWVDALLREPSHFEAIVREVRAVAAEVVSEPDDQPLGPDEGTRDRFREFARKRLAEG
ncbi:MAG: hypothetical protein ACYDA3_06390 [Gaiellaceae bacterium]